MAMRATAVLLSGLVNKVPWKLNHTRKANVRERVAGVRDVLRVLRETTPIKALASADATLPKSAHEMYFKAQVVDPYNKTGQKGIHKVPHFTKMPRVFESRHNK